MWHKSKKSLVFDTPQVIDFLKVDSDAALLPVDLTCNVNMIEKLVLSGTGTGGRPPDTQPDAQTPASSSHAWHKTHIWQKTGCFSSGA